jgi:DNA topoisomerase-1
MLREVNSKIKDIKFSKIDQESQGNLVEFGDEASAKKVYDTLSHDFKIYSIDEPTQKNSNPKEPYKTSTLQQDAINKLG